MFPSAKDTKMSQESIRDRVLRPAVANANMQLSHLSPLPWRKVAVAWQGNAGISSRGPRRRLAKAHGLNGLGGSPQFRSNSSPGRVEESRDKPRDTVSRAVKGRRPSPLGDWAGFDLDSYGGANRDRTGDLLLANREHSKLQIARFPCKFVVSGCRPEMRKPADSGSIRLGLGPRAAPWA